MSAPAQDNNVITLTGSLGEGSEPPKVICTCGWEYGPDSELMKLGSAAFKHRDETGHGLRQHSSETSD